MGKIGKWPRLVAEWPVAPADRPLIFSPCIAGLPAAIAADLAILPIHDANGRLLEKLPPAPQSFAPDFAGLCLSDPFIRLDDLLARLQQAGITGVANFPTVAAMLHAEDGEQFTHSWRRELQGLDAAAAAGFTILRIGPRTEGDAVGYRDLIV